MPLQPVSCQVSQGPRPISRDRLSFFHNSTRNDWNINPPMRVPRPPPLAGRPPKRELRPCLSERFHLGNTPARQSALRFSWAVTNAARFGTEKALEPLRRASDTNSAIVPTFSDTGVEA